MRCYRKILHISYKDHVTNEEVRAKIQQAIGPHEDLLTIVKRCKLQWYGHVSRLLDLAKIILQCTVKGRRRQGGQRTRWEENIREWTGFEFAKSQRAVENREKWRKLVAESSVVPQRPSRLRDRWDEMIREVDGPRHFIKKQKTVVYVTLQRNKRKTECAVLQWALWSTSFYKETNRKLCGPRHFTKKQKTECATNQ